MISGKVALGRLTWEFGDAEKRFAELSQETKALTRAQTKLPPSKRRPWRSSLECICPS